MEKRKPSILAVNLMYLLIAVLFLTIGAYTQEKNIYTGIFITEYIILVVPIVIFMLIRKYNFKEIFRLNKISLKQVGMTAGIVVLSYPIGVFLNLIGIAIINTYGEVQGTPIPTPENIQQFILGMFLFAITPGICEEIMFRGFIMRGYERIGAKKAAIYTGILFGIFHFNPQNLLGPAYLGILFGYMVYKTNSIYIGMIGHAINNGIALCLAWGSEKLLNVAQDLDPDLTNKLMDEATNGSIATKIPTKEVLISLISIGVVAAGCSFGVYALLKRLPKGKVSDESDKSEKIFIIDMIPVMVVIVLFLILSIIYMKHIKY